MRILVAEDETIIRIDLRNLLSIRCVYEDLAVSNIHVAMRADRYALAPSLNERF